MNKLNKLVATEFPVDVYNHWSSDEIQKKVKKAIKQKVEKSDARPKEEREHSPYIKFCKAERDGIKEKYPDLNAKGIISKLGERWNYYKNNDEAYLKKYDYVPKENK